MKVKSIQQLRRAIVTKKKLIENLASSNYEPDFMGYISQDHKKFGFFEAYHGDKKNVRAFLSTLLRIAEDGQAIYEFIQNAADCGSNMFSIFYDEKFFLALNNGKPFSNEDIDSLLNVSQSSKSSCDKIGRFGIGFKLVHRLVGKNEGLKELTEEYKGPILFTWSKPEHLTALISTENAEGIEYDSDMSSDAPTLFKIIITNFPVQPNEEVKTLEHENRVLFSSQEFLELVHFLKKNEEYIDFSRLERGSIFFLKLGEGKSEALHKHYQENLRKGVQCSLNMLKSLDTVIVNNERIERLPLKTIDFTILQNSETFRIIEPEYQKCDIKITFGYLPYSKNGSLKEYSNFYKYFPMGDEDHSLKFIIHCDAFNINASRRELQESTTNIEIFKWFITQLQEQLDSYKISKPGDFLEIYANLLLSERPKQSKQWLTESLYEPLIRYIKSNIPVQTGDFLTQDKVRIKGTLLSITPQDFGININWFYWEGKENEIVKAARDKQKLSLHTWKIKDLLNEGTVKDINYWVAQIDDKAYANFLDELNQIDFDKSVSFVDKFYLLKIFKFDDNYYSINELNNNENLILIFDKVQDIKNDLWKKLNLTYSKLNISKYKNLASQIKTVFKHFEVKVYERITSKAQKVRLTTQEKSSLFSSLVILDGIGDATIKQLTLFENRCQILTPLGQLIGDIKNLPFWLAIYQINEQEYVQCPQVNKYLLKENDIYDTIIQPEWEKIIEQVAIGDNIASFYEDVKRYFELSSNKSSLTNNAYIFTTQGFKTIDNVFYSSKLSQCQSYQNLKIAIETLTNLWVPSKIIVKYLSEPPFQTNQDSLYDCMEKVGNDSADLEQKAVENLIQFTNKIGEAFFTFFYVTRTTQSDIYLVYYKRNNLILQYFSEQPKLIKYIQRNLSDNFKALPAELYDKKINNTGLLVNEELYQELLTNYFSEDLIEFVKEAGFKSIELMFLHQIPPLALFQGEKYQKKSYTYQVLELACQCLTENALRESFTKKIRIYDRDRGGHEVRNISVNNDVTFAFNDKIYELKLSDILSQYKESSGLLAEIMEQLEGLSLRLGKLFCIERKKDLNEVYAELKQSNLLLQNASQLAFVILYAKYKNDINLLKEFMVKNNAE